MACSQFEVKDVAWDASLGAENLDLILLNHFADEFQEKHGFDVRTAPKAVAKLKRQVHGLPCICLVSGLCGYQGLQLKKSAASFCTLDAKQRNLARQLLTCPCDAESEQCGAEGFQQSGVWADAECVPVQAKKTKEVLSANTEAPISVEELHNGIDFRSRITRQAP